MFEIKTLQDEQKAREIGEFLIGPNVFDQIWFTEEKEMVKNAVFESLQSELHQYWYVENSGRYIHIFCCDTDSCAPTRAFYEKKGYQKVGEMPNYYVKGEGRVDYLSLIHI